MDSEKIFAKDISDKGLVLKIYKELNSKKKKKLKVLGKDLNRDPIKNLQMTNK